jgi:tetratricopeptide (TPR) repeat protein
MDEVREIEVRRKERSFAFILGAGASVTSGIPSGEHLARKWLTELHGRRCHDGSSLETWAEAALGLDEFTLDRVGEFYPAIFEARFRGDPEAGFAALEAEMDDKEPSLGYSLLAEILQRSRHKVVVTSFVRGQVSRPVVAKVHRDLLLNPRNDRAGVDELDQGWTEALRRLFQHRTPLVIGYGGNDGSLMSFLEQLSPADMAGRPLWCYREGAPPNDRVRAALARLNGITVAIAGFDEFMLSLVEVLSPDFDLTRGADALKDLGERRAASYRQQVETLQAGMNRTPDTSEAVEAARNALTRTIEKGDEWWSWELRANAEADLDRKTEIYEEGIKALPNSPQLLGNFANFQWIVRDDRDRAENLYRRAIEADPKQANNLGNYANFLMTVRVDHDRAEELYRRSIEIDPKYATTLSNYANFLRYVRSDHDRAGQLYRRAIEADPKHAHALGNYASFLTDIRGDQDRAEELYMRAIEADPRDVNALGNYACLLLQLLRTGEAREMACRARALVTGRSQVEAEVLLYLALIAQLNGRSARQSLGCLKAVITEGFRRGYWSFAALFAVVLPRIPEDERALFEAVGAAVLDAAKGAELERFAEWQALPVLPPDHPLEICTG